MEEGRMLGLLIDQIFDITDLIPARQSVEGSRENLDGASSVVQSMSRS
jgi:hypothetical protein